MASTIQRIWNNTKVFAKSVVGKGFTLRDPVQAWMTDSDSYDGRLRHVNDVFRNSVYMYTGITGAAETLASMALNVQDQTNDVVENLDDPSVRLLAKPNALQNWVDFCTATVILKILDGQVFWFTPERLSKTSEFRRAVYIAQDSEMTPIVSGGILTGWTYRKMGIGKPLDLPLEQVDRQLFFSPYDDLQGMPASTAVRLSIDSHYYATLYNTAALQNGGEPGAVYTTDQPLDPTQLKQNKESIRESNQGPTNARRPLILSNGLKYLPGTRSLQDMEWLEGKKISREEILSALKIPPVIAGIYEHATLNNSREQVLLFWDHRGLPIIKSMIAHWNEFVQRPIDRRRQVVPVITSVQALKEREIENHEKALGLQKFGLSLNALIDAHDLPYEKPPWGDVPLAPSGQVPITVLYSEAEMLMRSERQPEGLPAPEDEPEVIEPPKPKAFLEAKALIGEVTKALETEEVQKARASDQALHRAWFASWKGLRTQSANRFKAFLIGQGDRVVDRLQATELPDRPKGFTRDKASINEWLDAVLVDFKLDENDRLDVVSRFEFKQAAEFGGAQAIDEVSPVAPGEMPDAPTVDFNLDSSAMQRHLKQQSIRVREINKTTERRLRKTLLEGFKDGESITHLSERVADTLGESAGRRSALIAQTEVHEAISAGRHEGFKQAGVRAKRWLTSGRGVEPGGPVRKSHYHAQESTRRNPIAMGDKFVLFNVDTQASHKCDYPGEGTLPPEEKINCSCVQLAALKVGKAYSFDHYASHKFLTYEKHVERLAARHKAA